MDLILDEIDKALKRKGLSDAAASQLAVGHPSLIKNFRITRKSEKRYNLAALNKLAPVLGLELYFGPPRFAAPEPKPDLEINAEDFSTIDVSNVEAAAGHGHLNDDVQSIDKLAFRKDWLKQQGIDPVKARIIRVKGNSMEPNIKDKSLALIDLRQTDPTNLGIYAYSNEDGELRVKRLLKAGKTLTIMSDNTYYEPETLEGQAANRIRVWGRVMWTAYSWESGKDIK